MSQGNMAIITREKVNGLMTENSIIVSLPVKMDRHRCLVQCPLECSKESEFRIVSLYINKYLMGVLTSEQMLLSKLNIC